MKIRDMVVIKDKKVTTPSTWPLARIIEVHRGKDGLGRVAKLKSAKGTIERSLSKLVILPTESESVRCRPVSLYEIQSSLLILSYILDRPSVQKEDSRAV